MKKHHWHVFQHKKLFKKQPLPHCQTHSKNEEGRLFYVDSCAASQFLRLKNYIKNHWIFMYKVFNNQNINS